MTQAYSLKETSTPEVEPISVAEVKTFLRISHDGDDAVLSNYIKAARQFCETYTGIAMISRDFKVSFDISGKALRRNYPIPKAPVSAISSVKMVSYSAQETSLESGAYETDTGFNRIFIMNNGLNAANQRAIEINFIAGYGENASDIPETLRHAVLMKTAQMYESRGGEDNPTGFDIVDSLLRPYKKMKVYS